MKLLLFFKLLLYLSLGLLQAQDASLSLRGQAIGFLGYTPQADNVYAGGLRYLPELNFEKELDSGKTFSALFSANLYAGLQLDAQGNAIYATQLAPYRAWLRYSSARFELRLGLQKIDFGPGMVLRPLQWFNQIDPRDPLQLTNGVYGILGRYYFQNNANIWLWALYGNDRRRGFDLFPTQQRQPEFGGRIQHPVPRGELGGSFHHRRADARSLMDSSLYANIPENRFSIDGKWDIKIGLWFEFSHIRKQKNIGTFTRQELLTLGADYTFPLGNGLNLSTETLALNIHERTFTFENTAFISALTANYPLGLFDRLTGVVYQNWTQESFSFFVNYEHQFPHFTGYLMAFYAPSSSLQGVQDNELVADFSGPGLRVMFVFNH
jgi:hypothetical protein